MIFLEFCEEKARIPSYELQLYIWSDFIQPNVHSIAQCIYSM